MEEEKNIFFRYIPYLGSFIIFLGVERLIVYYGAFNIKIVNFLEFSEIITSFLDILTFIIFIISINIIQQFFFQENTDSEIRQRDSEIKSKLFDEGNFWERVKLYLIMFAGSFIGGLCGILLLQFIYSFWQTTSYWTYISTIILFLALLVITILLFESEIKHKRLNSNKESKIFIRSIFFFILVVGLLISITYDEVKSVKESKKYLNVVVTLNDSINLVSDSTHYYIGKTQNYLFFYDEKKQTTRVFSMNKVTEIQFPK